MPHPIDTFIPDLQERAMTTSASKASRDILEKSLNGALFDEFESPESCDTPLRTITNYEIFDKITGCMVGVDELGSNPNVAMRGTVLQPLPTHWRECMAKLLTTMPADSQLSSADFSSLLAQVNVPVLDWTALKDGDVVDGYCNKTFRWYEAKIVAVSADRQRYKIHFKGWNSKYDEWVERGCTRLVVKGAAEAIAAAAAEEAANHIPWYNTGNLMQRAGQMLGEPLPSAASQRVYIDGVEDYCVDYSYANPTLWVIAQSGAWYRLAGALCPAGCQGAPTDGYRATFALGLQKFLCATHIAMVLLDLLPVQPMANLQTIVEEATVRSGGLVNELLVLQHHTFLTDQLKSIELRGEPADEVSANNNKVVDISSSLFLSQLRREGAIFRTAGGLEALMAGTFKGTLTKRRQSILEGNWKPATTTVAVVPPSSPCDEELKESAAAKVRNGRRDYPMPDDDLWTLLGTTAAASATAGQPPDPPMPARSPQLPPEGEAQEQLLYMASILMHFPPHGQQLEDSITMSPVAVDPFAVIDMLADHCLLRTCFAPLLARVLEDQLSTTASPDLLAHSAGGDFVSILAFLTGRGDDGWLEVLKEVMRRSANGQQQNLFPNTADTMLVAEELLRDLLTLLPDACEPFFDELAVILQRIHSGWYCCECDAAPALVSCDTEAVIISNPPTTSASHDVGEIVDVYCPALAKWIEAVVADCDSEGYVVQYLSWVHADGSLQRIAKGDEHILPHRAASLDKTKRLSPEEMLEKLPHLAPIDLYDEAVEDETGSKGQGVQGFAADLRAVLTNFTVDNEETLAKAKEVVEFVELELSKRFEVSLCTDLSTEGNDGEEQLQIESRRLFASTDIWKLRLLHERAVGGADADVWAAFDAMDTDALQVLLLSWPADMCFYSLPLATRTHFLCRLCMDYMATEYVRETCNRIAEAKSSAELARRSIGGSSKTDATTYEDDEDDVETFVPTPSKRRRLSAAQSASNGIPENTSMSTLADLDSVTSNSRQPQQSMQLQQTMRVEALGLDRFGNTYWVFPHSQRVYCELRGSTINALRMASSPSYHWRVFSDARDLLDLLNWLNEKGTREMFLLHNLADWVIERQIFLDGNQQVATGRPEDPGRKKSMAIRDVYRRMVALRRDGVERIFCHHQVPTLPSQPIVPPAEGYRYLLIPVHMPRGAVQLGMGVKPSAVGNAQVFVTSFRPNSVAERHGLRIGDRLISAQGKVVDKVATLLCVLKALMDTDQDCTLLLLVCRHSQPIEDHGFKELVNRDSETAKAFSAQSTDPSITSINLLGEQSPVSACLTAALHLLDRTAHLCCSSKNWRNVQYPKYLEQLCSLQIAVAESSEEAEMDIKAHERNLLHALTCSLLDLEQDLRKVDVILKDSWARPIPASTQSGGTVSVRHYRHWRCMAMQFSPNSHCVAYFCALLAAAVDWDLLAALTQCVTLLPEDLPPTIAPVPNPVGRPSKAVMNARKSIGSGSSGNRAVQQLEATDEHWQAALRPGQRVLYFGDGHAYAVNHAMRSRASICTEGMRLQGRAYHCMHRDMPSSSSFNRSTAIWGNSIAPQLGKVWVCSVQSTRFFPSAPIPFAQVTLKHYEQSPVTLSRPALPKLELVSKEHHVNRLLHRALQALRRANNCRPFSSPAPVDANLADFECAITIVQARIQDLAYRNEKQFLRDLELLAEATEQQCSRDQRRTVAIAQELLSDARTIVSLWFTEGSDDGARGRRRSQLQQANKETENSAEEVEEEGTEATEDTNATETVDMEVDEARSTEDPRPRTSPGKVTTPTTETVKAEDTYFTVAVRLDSAACRYLVPWEVYQRSHQLMQSRSLPFYQFYPSSNKSSNGSGRHTIPSGKLTVDRTAVTYSREGRVAMGTVVGTGTGCEAQCSESTMRLMGWEFLNVDWIEPSEALLPACVNPWEVNFTS